MISVFFPSASHLGCPSSPSPNVISDLFIPGKVVHGLLYAFPLRFQVNPSKACGVWVVIAAFPTTWTGGELRKFFVPPLSLRPPSLVAERRASACSGRIQTAVS